MPYDSRAVCRDSDSDSKIVCDIKVEYCGIRQYSSVSYYSRVLCTVVCHMTVEYCVI